ncbi:MAG: S1C family serine protease, partial [Acidimicrobiales bacterium]
GGGERKSTIERRNLRRSITVATVLGAVGVVAGITVGILAFSGVFSSDGDGGDDEPDIPQIVATIRPSTLQVTAFVDGEPAGTGTGWVLDADDGLIVTNQHVTNGGETFTVGLDDERAQDATILASAPCQDLALLQVEDTAALETLPIGSQEDLRQGETVVAAGFPGSATAGGELAATTGVVSVVETTFDINGLNVPLYPNVIQTDSAINPGNSGGPLVNAAGEVVGINTAIIDDANSIGFAISIDTVRPLIDRALAGDAALNPDTAFLGVTTISVASLGEAVRTEFGVAVDSGAFVQGTLEGSPAEMAGILRGDVIVSIDGQNIASSEDVARTVRAMRPGDLVEIVIERDGETEQVSVTLDIRN